MTGLRITALSQKGNGIIKEIIGADDGRQDWMRFFLERVESERPYIIVIEYRNRIAKKTVPPAYLVEIIGKQMDALGAILKEDYTMEVIP